MAEDKVEFELVSPERRLASLEADMVVLPGAEGDFGVLPQHSPLMSALRPGVISVYLDNAVHQQVFVAGGFAEVNEGGCIVLAEGAEPLTDINRDAAERALKDAEEDYDEAAAKEETERLAAEKVLAVARARLEALGTGAPAEH